MVEPRGEKRIKGTAVEEGFHTLEMSFAVDPHGSGVHGSRPAPTCWVRERVAPGGQENTAPRGRFITRSPLPLPQTTTHTQQRSRVYRPGFRGRIPLRGAEEEEVKHKRVGCGGWRFENASRGRGRGAQTRAPPSLTPRAAPRLALTPHVPASSRRAPRPHGPGLRLLRPLRPSPPRPSPMAMSFRLQVPALHPCLRVPPLPWRALGTPVDLTQWMQLAPEASPARQQGHSRRPGSPGPRAHQLPPSPGTLFACGSAAREAEGVAAAAQLGLSLGPGRAGWQRQPLPSTPRGAERGFPAVTADLACSRQAAEGLSGRERPGRGRRSRGSE